jgi:hypothetical protein
MPNVVLLLFDALVVLYFALKYVKRYRQQACVGFFHPYW